MKKDKEIIETYFELVADKGEEPPNIDELPPERQAWYRNR